MWDCGSLGMIMGYHGHICSFGLCIRVWKYLTEFVVHLDWCMFTFKHCQHVLHVPSQFSHVGTLNQFDFAIVVALYGNMVPEGKCISKKETGKLTWNPKMEVWKMMFLFKQMIFRFHVICSLSWVGTKAGLLQLMAQVCSLMHVVSCGHRRFVSMAKRSNLIKTADLTWKCVYQCIWRCRIYYMNWR